MRALGKGDPTSVAGYRLLGVLGGGGMGRVYLGQSRTGRRLAIKMLSQQYTEDPEYRERFAREVAAASLVSPLYTAAVVDADPHAPTPWLATTFIEGPSLEQWVEGHGPLSPDRVLVLAAGLAEALGSIHSVSLVHRDLKPSNVIINANGPHIIDFGIALSGGDIRITTSLMLGTPAYMAPERINGLDAGPSGDVYSLGATLYYAATGAQLVARGSFYDQIIQVAQGKHDLSAAPEDCRPIIELCLQQSPQDRPTPEELMQVLVGLGVTTPEAGWWPELEPVSSPPTLSGGRGLTRRAVLAGAGAVGVVAVGGGVGFGLHQRAAPSQTTDSPTTTQTVPATPTGQPPPPSRMAWQLAVAADVRPSTPDPMALRVMVDRGQRLISPNGTEVIATDTAEIRVWAKPLRAAATPVRIWEWGDAVLAADSRRLWLLDAATGDQRFVEEVAKQEERNTRDNPDRMTVQIERIVIGGDFAVVSLGTAMVAFDRSCKEMWRAARPVEGGRRTALPVTVAAGETHLLTQSEGRIMLRQISSGRIVWQQTLPPAQPGIQRDGEEAWRRQEGRFTADAVVWRDGSTVEARALSGGRLLWRYPSPTPIASLEVFGDLALIGADRLVARSIATGSEVWISSAHASRVAGSGGFILVAHDNGLSKLDPASGNPVWHSSYPATIRDAGPDRLTADAEHAYVVFRQRPGGPRGPGGPGGGPGGPRGPGGPGGPSDGPGPVPTQSGPRPTDVVAFRLS